MKLCALAIALLSTAAGAQETMKATLVEGPVTLAAGGDLAEGAVLHGGDTVLTGADARLEILLPSGSVLRIGENSKLALGDAVPQKAFSAKLLLGNLWARVHKLISGETFHIETENAVAGVRGTEFRVEVARGQDDLLRVYEGAVQVDGAGGKWSHRVEAAQELRFHRDREPAGAKTFDAASEKGHKFMEWVRSRKEPFEYRNPEREHRQRRRKQR